MLNDIEARAMRRTLVSCIIAGYEYGKDVVKVEEKEKRRWMIYSLTMKAKQR